MLEQQRNHVDLVGRCGQVQRWERRRPPLHLRRAALGRRPMLSEQQLRKLHVGVGDSQQ